MILLHSEHSAREACTSGVFTTCKGTCAWARCIWKAMHVTPLYCSRGLIEGLRSYIFLNILLVLGENVGDSLCRKVWHHDWMHMHSIERYCKNNI